MTTAREEILARIRSQARPTEQPPAWESSRHFDDRPAAFTAALTSVAGEVIRAADLDEAASRLLDLLGELDAQRVVLNDEPVLRDLDLPGRDADITWHVVGQNDGDLRAFCESADVGISGADGALVATGSVVITSGPGKSRAATLLPPVHVAVVRAEQLTTDLFTWTAARGGDMPVGLTLVSGPSKTADIEQRLVIGVHGPVRFIVVLVEE